MGLSFYKWGDLLTYNLQLVFRAITVIEQTKCQGFTHLGWPHAKTRAGPHFPTLVPSWPSMRPCRCFIDPNLDEHWHVTLLHPRFPIWMWVKTLYPQWTSRLMVIPYTTWLVGFDPYPYHYCMMLYTMPIVSLMRIRKTPIIKCNHFTIVIPSWFNNHYTIVYHSIP